MTLLRASRRLERTRPSRPSVAEPPQALPSSSRSAPSPAPHRSRHTELGARKRQVPNSLPGGGKDGVREGGHERRYARFPYAGGRSAALDDVYIGLVGRFVDARQRVVVEIRLLDDPILGGDLPAADDAGPEDRRAFELGAGGLRVHDQPRVEDGIHARDPECPNLTRSPSANHGGGGPVPRCYRF